MRKDTLYKAMIALSVLSLVGCGRVASRNITNADKLIDSAKDNVMRNTMEGYDEAYNVLTQGICAWDGDSWYAKQNLSALKEYYPRAYAQALQFAKNNVNKAHLRDEIIAANMGLRHVDLLWSGTQFGPTDYGCMGKLNTKSRLAIAVLAKELNLTSQERKSINEKLANAYYAASHEVKGKTEAERHFNNLAYLMQAYALDQKDIDGLVSPGLQKEIAEAYKQAVVSVVVRSTKDISYQGKMVGRKSIIPGMFQRSASGSSDSPAKLPELTSLLNEPQQFIRDSDGSVMPRPLLKFVSKPTASGLNYYFDLAINSAKTDDEVSNSGYTTDSDVGSVDCGMEENPNYDSSRDDDRKDRKDKIKIEKNRNRKNKGEYKHDREPRYIKTCIDSRQTITTKTEFTYLYKNTRIGYSYNLQDNNHRSILASNGLTSKASEGEKIITVDGVENSREGNKEYDPIDLTLSIASNDLINIVARAMCHELTSDAKKCKK
ncbi:hypothetical protein IV503_12615 [Klebsiella huaxiensis]|uniref:hypothetical protein n=1 Tax=Klebsiella huaxiensis TaxID=2153354 RepID=UPI002F331BEB